MQMRLSILVVFALGILQSSWQWIGNNAIDWRYDLPKALLEAKRTNRNVVLLFSGSDWCLPCKRFEAQVLSTHQIVKCFKRNVIAVLIDIRQVGHETIEQQTMKVRLMEHYNIQGFPTLVVLDSSGSKIAERAGYDGGPPKATVEFIEHSIGNANLRKR